MSLLALLLSTTLSGTDATPVAVVEMFTSQGCSSCPPADAQIRELNRAGQAAGVEVIPLAFHVDYWNYIGWRDPFSSPQWTDRQRLYAQALPSGVYTPQAVVSGQTHEVGSRRAALLRAINENAYRGPRTLRVRATRSSRTLRVNVTGSERPGSELVVLVTESGVETDVKRGENRGRELRNDAIVRALHAETPPRQGSFTTTVNFGIDESWTGTLKAVALWQDPVRRRIYDATQSVVETGSNPQWR